VPLEAFTTPPGVQFYVSPGIQFRMSFDRLGLAWLVCALTLAPILPSCVSPEELRREDEAMCAGYGFHPGTSLFFEQVLG
jgi:hypothetical protein